MAVGIPRRLRSQGQLVKVRLAGYDISTTIRCRWVTKKISVFTVSVGRLIHQEARPFARYRCAPLDAVVCPHRSCDLCQTFAPGYEMSMRTDVYPTLNACPRCLLFATCFPCMLPAPSCFPTSCPKAQYLRTPAALTELPFPKKGKQEKYHQPYGG